MTGYMGGDHSAGKNTTFSPSESDSDMLDDHSAGYLSDNKNKREDTAQAGPGA